MLPILTTERLILRPFHKNDLPDLIRLNKNAAVMQYIGNGKVRDEEESKKGMERFLNFPIKSPGFGVWSAFLKDIETYIGFYALKNLDNTEEIEVGYRLDVPFWGMGYATEGASRLLKYGFEDQQLDRIVGVTHPSNTASQKVLLKIGLQQEGEGHYYGGRCIYFGLNRKGYLK